MNANGRLCEVFAATVDHEMDLQAVIGAQILKRYKIAGDIEKVNNLHRLNVLDYIQSREDKPCTTLQS